MRKIALLACLAVLVPNASLPAKPVASSAKTSGKPPKAASIGVVPIYLSGRRAVVALRIGSHPPSPVVFDTGTSGNDLDTGYATTIQLKYDPTVSVQVGDGTGHTFIAKQAKVPVASLGGVPISEKTATVFPYGEQDVVGIFGPNSFSGSRILLDLGNGRAIVRDQAHSAAIPANAMPYLKSRLPAVMLQLPGMALPAMLDSGNNSVLILPESLAHELPLRGSLRIAGKVSTVSGERDFYEGDLAGEVRIGHLVLSNPTVMFSGNDVANVGLPIIRQLLIMLDPKEQRSWLVEPRQLSADEMQQFAGKYGIRTVRVESNALTIQRENLRRYVLRFLGDDLFGVEGNDDVVQFRREAGRVVGMDHVSGAGKLTKAGRTT